MHFGEKLGDAQTRQHAIVHQRAGCRRIKGRPTYALARFIAGSNKMILLTRSELSVRFGTDSAMTPAVSRLGISESPKSGQVTVKALPLQDVGTIEPSCVHPHQQIIGLNCGSGSSSNLITSAWRAASNRIALMCPLVCTRSSSVTLSVTRETPFCYPIRELFRASRLRRE
jgi:hypothetical protein